MSATEARLGTVETAMSSGIRDIIPDNGTVSSTELENAVQPPVNTIKRRYTALFEMYEAGKSMDMIAKSTGMQRGEVQLILQLAKQEEST